MRAGVTFAALKKMNLDQLEGFLKQLFGSTRDKLAGRVQEQRGNLKAIADRQLAEFRSRNRNWLDLSK